jgi:hypothetical protein
MDASRIEKWVQSSLLFAFGVLLTVTIQRGCATDQNRPEVQRAPRSLERQVRVIPVLDELDAAKVPVVTPAPQVSVSIPAKPVPAEPMAPVPHLLQLESVLPLQGLIGSSAINRLSADQPATSLTAHWSDRPTTTPPTDREGIWEIHGLGDSYRFELSSTGKLIVTLQESSALMTATAVLRPVGSHRFVGQIKGKFIRDKRHLERSSPLEVEFLPSGRVLFTADAIVLNRHGREISRDQYTVTMSRQ